MLFDISVLKPYESASTLWDTYGYLETAPPYHFCWSHILYEGDGWDSYYRFVLANYPMNIPALYDQPFDPYEYVKCLIVNSSWYHHAENDQRFSSDDAERLGEWIYTRCSGGEGENEFRKEDLDQLSGSGYTGNFTAQFVKVVEIDNLTLNKGDVFKPMPFDAYYYKQASVPTLTGNYVGGIFAIKVENTLTLNGGHIDLTGAGILPEVDSYRPLSEQEKLAALDSDSRAGEENSLAVERMPLNVGDGACFIFAKNIVVTDPSSRIGNPNLRGVANCRGAADDSNTPNGATNIGGSNIFIACETFKGFNPAIISKYRSGSADDGLGKGLSRAFIHVEKPYLSDVPNDGRLYYLDTPDFNRKLCYRLHGQDNEIPLYDSANGKAVALNTSDGIFYANLVSESDSEASEIRIRIGDSNYALKR